MSGNDKLLEKSKVESKLSGIIDKPSTVSLRKSTAVLRLSSLYNDNKSNTYIKRFLDIPKRTYQMHDNLEELLLANGMIDIADWIKSKGLGCNPKPNIASVLSETQVSVLDIADDESRSISLLKSELQEHLTTVTNGGAIDSGLPWVMSASHTLLGHHELAKKSFSYFLTDAPLRKDSVEKCADVDTREKSTLEVFDAISNVEIHVYDEVKHTIKDFVCNQKLLLEQVGYFADVTKEQCPGDMDITINCDLTVFEWLMSWIKRNEMSPGNEPVLEVNWAMPILKCACILQMEPLINECLHFLHRNMSEILKKPSSFSCINDTILTRLAALYTNTEVEAVKDKKDKIKSKLFCKLIQSLCEIESETCRGHYCTMAKVYRCKDCGQLINPTFAGQIPCVAHAMSLQFDGSILNRHRRDLKWDINIYIRKLYKSLKSWRKVYWRLWGACHFLHCTTCDVYFPVNQAGWCRYHPDEAQYFTLDSQPSPIAVGRYPCCGQRAFRFQILEDRAGCQYRDHTIESGDITDTPVANILQSMRSVVTVEPPKVVYPKRHTRFIVREPTDPDDIKLKACESFWWEGLEIVPPRPKLGLLGAIRAKQADDFLENNESEPSSTSSGSDRLVPEESLPLIKVKKQVRGENSHQWQVNQSTRSNQDFQRFYEEAAFKKMTDILNTRTKLPKETKNCKSYQVQRRGGIWVRLEAEWREKSMQASNKRKSTQNGKVRLKFFN